jgi:hypothetical protein
MRDAGALGACFPIAFRRGQLLSLYELVARPVSEAAKRIRSLVLWTKSHLERTHRGAWL